MLALDYELVEQRLEGGGDGAAPAKGHCMVLDKLWDKVLNKLMVECQVLVLFLKSLRSQCSVVTVTHLDDVDLDWYLLAAQSLPDLLGGGLVARIFKTCNDQQVWPHFQFH